MNNLLDLSSPLEALALNYASFGGFTVVNNLWTWVAVVTAAISFWRIRTTSFSDKPDHQQPHIDRNTSGSQVNQSGNTHVEPQAKSPSPASVPSLPSVFDVKDVDGVTEVTKFTLYYYEEEEEEEKESDGCDRDGEATVVKEWRDADVDDYDNGVICGEWWESVTMRARIETMGWYHYQDMTVVNGNVVRVWDDCRRRSERAAAATTTAVWSLVN